MDINVDYEAKDYESEIVNTYTIASTQHVYNNPDVVKEEYRHCIIYYGYKVFYNRVKVIIYSKDRLFIFNESYDLEFIDRIIPALISEYKVNDYNKYHFSELIVSLVNEIMS